MNIFLTKLVLYTFLSFAVTFYLFVSLYIAKCNQSLAKKQRSRNDAMLAFHCIPSSISVGNDERHSNEMGRCLWPAVCCNFHKQTRRKQ